MGYNKMISTKNATTLKREMEKFKDNNLIQHQKISLPLVMFDNIKENVQFLNKYNSYESIKVILYAILTVLIPSTEKTMKENYSNNAICNLLGNECIVAIASVRLKSNKTTSDMYCSFDIGKVQNITEESYTKLMCKRLLNSNIYSPIAPIKALNVLHSDIRYYFEDTMQNLDDRIVLDIELVQEIFLNCFNGSD